MGAMFESATMHQNNKMIKEAKKQTAIMQAQAQGNTDSDTRQSVTEKSPRVAALLCLFAGILGAHKFYLGHPKLGVLYALTMGLGGFGVIYDLHTLGMQCKRSFDKSVDRS